MSWKGYEVVDAQKYRLHLCQTAGGTRIFRLASIESDADKIRSDEVFFATEIVPNDLLKISDLGSIVKSVKLENGQPFFVDAHRMWMTESEFNQLNNGVDEIQWSTGKAPRFAQR